MSGLAPLSVLPHNGRVSRPAVSTLLRLSRKQVKYLLALVEDDMEATSLSNSERDAARSIRNRLKHVTERWEEEGLA